MDQTTMSRPKKTTPKPKLEPKSIAFRVSGEYGEWVDKLAASNRTNVASLLDQALAKFAREIGFTEAPPER